MILFGSNEKLVEQYIAQDLIENIYNSLGLKLKIVPLPPPRAMKENLDKTIDGEIARIAPYGDDKPSLIRIDPSYYYLESAAYCLIDSTLKITSAQDLKGLKVATIRGVAHSNVAIKGLKNAYQLGSAVQLFEYLKYKRADIVIDTEINGRRLLKQDEYRPFLKNCGVFARFVLHNYINDNRKDVGDRVSSKIEELKQSGELEKMINAAEKKYLSLGPDNFD
jgi:ABC-type amino acid transport substrate-binding protein